MHSMPGPMIEENPGPVRPGLFFAAAIVHSISG